MGRKQHLQEILDPRDTRTLAKHSSLLSAVFMAKLLLALVTLCPQTSGQTTKLSQCRQQCYTNYLKLYQYYCPWGQSCNYTNYTAQFYVSCYKACNEQSMATTPPPPTPSTIKMLPPNTNGCGVSLVGRGSWLPGGSIEARIVGGRLANECELPWTVVVNIGTTFCGGSIIDGNTILTAGHCVFLKTGYLASPNTIVVKYGSSDQTRMSNAYVSRVLPHPKFYLPYYDYDSALLTLTSPLSFSQCTQPICLPEPNAVIPSDCMAAGWGALSYSQPSAQQNLNVVSLPIVQFSDCLAAYGSRYFNDTKLCAGNLIYGGIDSCLGDSGGPLMCSVKGAYVLHGTVSFGKGCANPGFPGVYARVSHPAINTWIRKNMID